MTSHSLLLYFLRDANAKRYERIWIRYTDGRIGNTIRRSHRRRIDNRRRSIRISFNRSRCRRRRGRSNCSSSRRNRNRRSGRCRRSIRSRSK